VKDGRLKPEEIDTEVFLLPAAAVAEGDGSFTNTQRLVQFHEKAVDPPGDARTDLWFTYHLGKRLKKLYEEKAKRAGKEEDRDRPIKALLWDYDDPEESDKWRIKDEPSARLVLKEINGYTVAEGLNLLKSTPLTSFAELKDDGTTACGAWIYTGVYAPTKD